MSDVNVSTPVPYTQEHSEKTGIYQWRNLVNGKVYVGSASRTFERRRSLHVEDLTKQKHANRLLQRAWNKYGEANLVFEILEECEPDKCIEREQYWMDKLNSANRRFGYNLAPKAGNTRGLKWSLKSRKARAELSKKLMADPERRAKMAEANRKKWRDPEYRAKMIEIAKEIQQINQNRPEMKAIRSEKGKKNWEDPEYRQKIIERATEANNRPEVKAQRTASIIEANKRPEVNIKRSASLRKSWSETDEDAKAKRLAGFAEHRTVPELAAKKTSAIKQAWVDKTEEEMAEYRRKKKADLSSPEVRAKIKAGCIRGCARPEVKARKSETSKKSWADPEIRARRSAAIKAAWARRKQAELERREEFGAQVDAQAEDLAHNE